MRQFGISTSIQSLCRYRSNFEPTKHFSAKRKKYYSRKGIPSAKVLSDFFKVNFLPCIFRFEDGDFSKHDVKIELDELSRKLFSKKQESVIRGRGFPLGKCSPIFSSLILDQMRSRRKMRFLLDQKAQRILHQCWPFKITFFDFV